MAIYLSQVAVDLAREAAADRVLTLLNSGHLSMHGGEPSDQQHGHLTLADLRFAEQAFGPAPEGKSRANPILPGTAIASGRATWFRCWAADGTYVMRGSCGEPSENGDPQPDLIVNSTDIKAGATISIAMFQYRQG